jgi:hypothetical protein
MPLRPDTRFLLPVLVFALAFVLYFLTLAPGVFW